LPPTTMWTSAVIAASTPEVKMSQFMVHTLHSETEEGRRRARHIDSSRTRRMSADFRSLLVTAETHGPDSHVAVPLARSISLYVMLAVMVVHSTPLQRSAGKLRGAQRRVSFSGLLGDPVAIMAFI
jgi:hypothetical protein